MTITSKPDASPPSDNGAGNELVFKPAARLQFLLSEELVSDPNVAVLEFVKNGYDADADDVLVDFELSAGPAGSRLIIADNGLGMDLAEFERNWMHPGFSGKFEAKPTAKRQRVQVGEKGLGRLAAGRLGATLDVYTRKAPSEPWLHAFFRWADFNRMDVALDEIKIRWDYDSEPPVELETGTVVEINDLSLKWNSRPPGRRPKNRATTRLGRLRQDLEVLLVPIAAAGQNFTIRLEHDSDLDEDESGPVLPSSLDLLEYEYRFDVEKDAKGDWLVKRTVRRAAEVADETDRETTSVEVIAAADFPEEIDFDAAGAFSGSMFYAPRSAKRFKQLRVPTGVRIYRDGVRIDPYGDPSDDWLGANERKAVRQGHAAIAPNALYGAVHISKRANPDLKPLVNREGLIENPAVEAFISICRAEFGNFGEVIQEEFLDPKWDRSQAQKRSDSAFETRQWALGMARATAHAVRQPITSAGAELSRLKMAVGRVDIPDDVREHLLELEDNTRLHLRRIDQTVERMLSFHDIDPEPKLVNLLELIGDVIDHVEPDATSAGVVINDETGLENLEVQISPGILEHAVEELLENAIRVPRPKGRSPIVTVRVERDDREVRVEVWDNGTGVPDDVQAQLFTQSVSRTGHVGVGLMFNRQLMQIARGDVRLVATGETGTKFQVVVPA